MDTRREGSRSDYKVWKLKPINVAAVIELFVVSCVAAERIFSQIAPNSFSLTFLTVFVWAEHYNYYSMLHFLHKPSSVMINRVLIIDSVGEFSRGPRTLWRKIILKRPLKPCSQKWAWCGIRESCYGKYLQGKKCTFALVYFNKVSCLLEPLRSSVSAPLVQSFGSRPRQRALD